jgi:hypothetical protein
MASSAAQKIDRRYQRMDELRAPLGFRGRSAVYTQLWLIVQSTLFGLSPQAFYGWRRWLLRLFGASTGKGVFLRPSVFVQRNRKTPSKPSIATGPMPWDVLTPDAEVTDEKIFRPRKRFGLADDRLSHSRYSDRTRLNTSGILRFNQPRVRVQVKSLELSE